MSPMRRFLLILALTLMWSPSFLFIKLALTDFQPLTLAALRVSIAAIVLFLILILRGGSLPKEPKFWLHATIMAFFASAAPFYLFSYAEQSIESALAAILNGTAPMFTVMLARIFFPQDRLTPQKLLGIALSSAGLLLLFAPNIMNGLSGTFGGIMAATGASMCYAASHIFGKKYISGYKPFVAPTAQLAMSSVLLTPLAFIFESPLTKLSVSWTAIGGILGLVCFGTILAFILYYKLLEHSGPTAISTVACFFPAVGMLLGFLFLGESLSLASLLASGLILTGLMTVNELYSLPGLKPKLTTTQSSS